jgi:hypothetical protein
MGGSDIPPLLPCGRRAEASDPPSDRPCVQFAPGPRVPLRAGADEVWARMPQRLAASAAATPGVVAAGGAVVRLGPGGAC